jgi:hypothetical protein
MDIRERLIIRTDGCLKQPFPKAAAFRPTRLQVSSLLKGDAIYFRGSHLDEGRRNRRRHSKYQIERARCRSADRQGIHQDLPDKQYGALGLWRVRGLREQRIGPLLTRALPPLGALKIQVDEKDRAAPRPLAHARIHLRPQRREHRISVGPLGQERDATRVQLAHRSQGALGWPTLRLDRRPQYFLFLSHGRFVPQKNGSEFSIEPLGLRCGVSRYLQ